MLAEIKPLLYWLHENPHLAGLATFAISFLESIAIVGLFMPGTVFMTAIGTLIGTGNMPLVSTMLWAIGGAILGDVISFAVGYFYHEGVRDLWPLRHFPDALQKGEVFFKKHGGKSIFLGRFIGPLRPILPLIAGMLSMSPRRFIIVDVLSAIVWAPAYMLPGIFLGAASQQLAPEAATRLILYVIFALLIIWCVSWLLQRASVALATSVNKTLASLWYLHRTEPKLKVSHSVLEDPMNPESHSQLTLALGLILCFIALVILASQVYHFGPLIGFNVPIYHLMRSLRNPVADSIFVGITLLGNYVLVFSWLVVLAYLAWRKNWWAACHWLGLGILAICSMGVLKHFIHETRPPGLLKPPSSWSFPSGHSTVSMAILGFFAILLARDWPKSSRWLTYISFIVIIGLILFSRLYLTAHWLNDVIGGALLGFCCLALFTISYRRRVTTSINTKEFLMVGVGAFIFFSSITLAADYFKALNDYKIVFQAQAMSTSDWWQQVAGQSPLYRTNRFGTPMQVINVEWAGDLDSISQSLTAHRWVKVNQSSIVGAINGFANQNTQYPIILGQLYGDRLPKLVMYKSINDQEGLVVILRLWDSRTSLSDGQNLWIGTVGYYRPLQLRLLLQQANTAIDFPDITSVLINDLGDFDWKRIAYPYVTAPVREPYVNWDGYVVYIKPKGLDGNLK